MPWKQTEVAPTVMMDRERRRHTPSRQPQLMPADGRSLTLRLLEDRRNELLEQLRPMAPDLVHKLEMTLEALEEQWPARGEYDGLDRSGVIRQYLEKVGHPASLREIRDAVASPASRFHGRSIWDGGKREVEQGRLLNLADPGKGEDWLLALPEWHAKA
jgi:hypothetical protein